MASSSIEMLEECKISPPQNSVGTTKIPLTFFDMPWILGPVVEGILFYEFPHPTIYFTESILPQLKHSLSLALQLYFPFAGSLVCDPLPMEPYILYRDGDFVPFTVAQSNSDFHRLVGNGPKNAAIEFEPLIPCLSNEMITLVCSDDQVPSLQALQHLLALQVTIFPNAGISISLAFRHGVADGRALTNFLKSWGALSRSKNSLSVIPQPYHDRATVIKDPNGLASLLCKQYLHEQGISWDGLKPPAASTSNITTCVKLEDHQERLHATFVLGCREIALLKNWITSRLIDTQLGDQDQPLPPPPPHVSTYVVTAAFIWVCLTKTKFINDNTSTDDAVPAHFLIMADSTDKLEPGVPKTYIGNCLVSNLASLVVNELVSENGLPLAAKGIMQKIQELETATPDKLSGLLPTVFENNWSMAASSEVCIAGSPKLRIYDIDYGWGKPKKFEMVHINKEVGTFTLAESRDEKGGIEVGISLCKTNMDAFTSIFELGLRNCVA